MKQVLITGANGFVGQHLINQLKDEYSLTGLVHNSKSIIPNAPVLEGDVTNPQMFEDVFTNNRPEVIFHLAGLATSSGFSLKEYMNINAYGTKNLYQAIVKMKKLDDYNPKVIFISSSHIYGGTNRSQPITEDQPFNPKSDYAQSKVEAEKISQQYVQDHGLRVAIIRQFNQTGSNQGKGFFGPDMESQIAQIENSYNAGVLKVGDLNVVRDYLDVRDVVRAYQKLINLEYLPGEVFNICSGRGVSMQEFLDILLSFSSAEIKVEIDSTRQRSTEAEIFIGDPTKFKRATGWKPEIPMEKTLRDLLESWRIKISSGKL